MELFYAYILCIYDTRDVVDGLIFMIYNYYYCAVDTTLKQTLIIPICDPYAVVFCNNTGEAENDTV